MKSDREFIDGIYEKARMLEEQKTHNDQENNSVVEQGKSWFRRSFNIKLRAGMAVMAMAVLAVILMPRIFVEQGNSVSDDVDGYSIEPAAYGIDNQRAISTDIISGEGIFVDSFVDNEESYYLIELSDHKAADEAFAYVVLYNNGYNSDKIETATNGANVSFTYVDTPISILATVQEVLNKQFEQKLSGNLIGDIVAVYPIDSLQIKE